MSRSFGRVAIIGAGSSGIAMARALHAAGIPFDAYEVSDRVGGNWVYQNKNGMSACYRGLYINTSKTRMAYPEYPMPADYPDFPHHSQIAAYFDQYVDHFGFRKAIRFETRVTNVSRAPSGGFTLEHAPASPSEPSQKPKETEHYDAVAVANGHHWDPRWPDPPFPGTFTGEVMHAHHYEDAKVFEGKRVLVLGMGNSAMDISVEASYVAERTVLSSRRGAWVIPKYLFGRPLDTILTSAKVPYRIRRRFGEALMKASVGSMSSYGLPEPDHRLGSAHPTISGRILDRLVHGAISYKPNIARLDGRTVHFVDGSQADFDVLVYCTGYKVTFPFFAPSFVSAKDNDLPLFRRVFHPTVENLFFLGLLQPLGAIMPLASAQSEWLVDYLEGRYLLPPPAEMRADIEGERTEMFERYVASPRHTMQVDFDDYLLALEKERARGAARAEKLARSVTSPRA
jgi:dimethylaniline monooxygenase (N-oxide forming)